ncbi:hypothetical protein [Streptomyces sp. CoH27]|uniref:hypothetical protein n=1 Tax=Streptomyces sp. CoH27 TaxID=2875763 RepID=UPI0027DF4C1F|nr:hypothetical protein [Streptomyces sp. CoH27]
MGIWLKNQRAAARKAAETEQPRGADGLSAGPAAGAMSGGRREQLQDINPSWTATNFVIKGQTGEKLERSFGGTS